jgi:alkylresorcinol/alkylpyrone synthase
MSKAVSVGTADAPFCLHQTDVKEFIYSLFSNTGMNINRLIGVFDNANVSRRHFSAPISWFGSGHSFPVRNNVFIDTALKMSIEAINNCLQKVNAAYTDIDHIFFVTSTGLSTPTIDALLINELKFNSHIKRTPIWGLGCAGGAAGLSRAMEYTKAYPDKTALLVVVELCSLTFQKDDLSKSNVIATSLFSDGAAAVLVVGDKSKFSGNKGILLKDSLSTTYYDSLDVMGWDIVEEGFKVIFSHDIPAIVRECVLHNIMELLSEHKLSLPDIKHYVTHPGGVKVMKAYEDSLGLTNGLLDNAKKVLDEHGNMSSASVLYVLNEFLTQAEFNAGELGLITALGPGFSSELILFKCT